MSSARELKSSRSLPFRRLVIQACGPSLVSQADFSRSEKSGTEIQSIGSEEDGGEQACAAKEGQRLQDFGFNVGTGRKPGKCLNQCCHLRPPCPTLTLVAKIVALVQFQ